MDPHRSKMVRVLRLPRLQRHHAGGRRGRPPPRRDVAVHVHSALAAHQRAASARGRTTGRVSGVGRGERMAFTGMNGWGLGHVFYVWGGPWPVLAVEELEVDIVGCDFLGHWLWSGLWSLFTTRVCVCVNVGDVV